MGGKRTNDNCYGITAKPHLKCNKTSTDASALWHQRLGHLNYHDFCKLSKRMLLQIFQKLIKSIMSFVDHAKLVSKLGLLIRRLLESTLPEI